MTSAYIEDVAAHLTFGGSARQQSLNDLRDLLSDPAISLDELGSPTEYAAALNEMFDGGPTRLLGMPVSLAKGIGRRMAGTFDPADQRLIIPRLFGLGWTLNLGRVAVGLGLLNPDDVDDDVLEDAVTNLGTPQMVASAIVATAAGSAALLAVRRETSEAELGESLLSSVAFGTLFPIVSAALIAASADRELPAAQRLTMPAIAASLATISGGMCLQQATRPRSKRIALGSLALAFPLQLALSYLPVRAALRRGWGTDHHA